MLITSEFQIHTGVMQVSGAKSSEYSKGMQPDQPSLSLHSQASPIFPFSGLSGSSSFRSLAWDEPSDSSIGLPQVFRRYPLHV